MNIALLNTIISFIFSILLCPLVILVVKKLKGGQNILEYVGEHIEKQGTPSMGGVSFILVSIIGFLLFCNNSYNLFSLVSLLAIIGFGIIGFLDDFIKVKLKQNLGLHAYQKFFAQVFLALIIAIFVYNSNILGTTFILPFTHKLVDIKFFIIPIIVLIYLAIVNSVNLLDGLDGLSASVTGIVIFIYAICIYIYCKNIDSINIQMLQNLNIFIFGVVGAILGFLIFNSNPAVVFMGDTGSLALGGLVASIVILSKQYFLIFIVGAIYILTTMSVILQVGCFKLTKKRIFKIAPFHHHLQKSGLKEAKICALYIIITIILGATTLFLYVI